MQAIINGLIVSAEGKIRDKALVFNERIIALCPRDELEGLPIRQIFDAGGLIVAPGLIDVHIHGYGGYDCIDGNEALEKMALALVKEGVTAFLPTTMAGPWPQVEALLRGLKPNQGARGFKGARVLGVHLEGPFLSPCFRGAHLQNHLMQPNFSLIEPFQEKIKIITFAPELPGAQKFLRQLLQWPHVVAAIGHSGATYAETMSAIDLGVRHATHLFNAMSPLHHRQPGPVGAVLRAGISTELIADDLHIHPGIYNLLLKVLGKERLILVSDAMRAAGLGPGCYDLGGQKIFVKGGSARLADGRLAGSVIALPQALRNFKKATNCDTATVLKLVTRNPARLLNVDSDMGGIATGKLADFVLFDNDLNVKQTYVGGRIVYSTLAKAPKALTENLIGNEGK